MKYHFQPYLTRLEHIMEQPQQTLFLPTDLQIEELEQRQVMAAAVRPVVASSDFKEPVMNDQNLLPQCIGNQLEDANLLQIEELEERTSFAVHGACACTCSCNCTSCSCVILF